MRGKNRADDRVEIGRWRKLGGDLMARGQLLRDVLHGIVVATGHDDGGARHHAGLERKEVLAADADAGVEQVDRPAQGGELARPLSDNFSNHVAQQRGLAGPGWTVDAHRAARSAKDVQDLRHGRLLRQHKWGRGRGRPTRAGQTGHADQIAHHGVMRQDVDALTHLKGRTEVRAQGLAKRLVAAGLRDQAVQVVQVKGVQVVDGGFLAVLKVAAFDP